MAHDDDKPKTLGRIGSPIGSIEAEQIRDRISRLESRAANAEMRVSVLEDEIARLKLTLSDTDLEPAAPASGS
jgi:hypothetical protein